MDPILGFFQENLREVYRVPSNRRVRIENLNVVNTDVIAHYFYIYMTGPSIYPQMVPILKPGISLGSGESFRDTDGYCLGPDNAILLRSDAVVGNTLSFAIFGSDIK